MNLIRSKFLEIGKPKKNNEYWTFFPVSLIPDLEPTLEDFSEITNSSLENSKKIEYELGISDEKDFSALLPLAKSCHSFKKIISKNTTEHAIIKSREQFSHGIFEVEENATLFLEILDHKIPHSIISERIDLFISSHANVHILIANPRWEFPLKFSHFKIHQKENSNVYIYQIEQGGGTKRTSIDSFLEGKNSKIEMRFLNAIKGKDSIHHRITIHHLEKETQSHQYARNLLKENSYASYDGNVIVAKNCNKVFSSQLVNTILMSEEASVSVKPILKIYHDDVECTHGNTCGELDKEMLFYLTSRGLTEKKAKEILEKAFAKEIFSHLENTPFNKQIHQILQNLN